MGTAATAGAVTIMNSRSENLPDYPERKTGKKRYIVTSGGRIRNRTFTTESSVRSANATAKRLRRAGQKNVNIFIEDEYFGPRYYGTTNVPKFEKYYQNRRKLQRMS